MGTFPPTPALLLGMRLIFLSKATTSIAQETCSEGEHTSSKRPSLHPIPGNAVGFPVHPLLEEQTGKGLRSCFSAAYCCGTYGLLTFCWAYSALLTSPSYLLLECFPNGIELSLSYKTCIHFKRVEPSTSSSWSFIPVPCACTFPTSSTRNVCAINSTLQTASKL